MNQIGFTGKLIYAGNLRDIGDGKTVINFEVEEHPFPWTKDGTKIRRKCVAFNGTAKEFAQRARIGEEFQFFGYQDYFSNQDKGEELKVKVDLFVHFSKNREMSVEEGEKWNKAASNQGRYFKGSHHED